MGDRQWPDPQGFEALTQAEAERDAGRSDLARALELLLKAFAGDFTLDNEREYDAVKTVVAALAVAERERDQAREALRQIAAIQPRALAIIERHGFVFDSIGAEPGNWQHLAFTIYTELCEAETIARGALAE